MIPTAMKQEENKPLTGVEKLWSDLKNLDPIDVTRRTGSRHLDGMYIVEFMKGEYEIDPAKSLIKAPETHPLRGGELELLLLAYLVDAKNIDVTGRWISEKEIPGGSLFFAGPHKMPLDPIASRYGNDPGAFIERAVELGGKPLEYGDASAAFDALPRIPVAFVLWEADDEFPAEVTVMFDETVSKHIPVDVCLALVGSTVGFLV